MKIIIVGAGEVGYHIAARLVKENKDVVVIDTSPGAVRRLADTLDVQVIQGSGSSPAVLEEAGIGDAEILLAVTDSDEVNLVACLAANCIAPSIKKLARIRGAGFDGHHQALKEAAPHIDTIINPEIEVVRTIDRFMQVPGAVDVGELAGGRIRFAGVRLGPDSVLTGIRLHRIAEKIGRKVPLIAAVVRDETMTIPDGNTRLEPGDIVYFISEAQHLDESMALFDKAVAAVRRVMIIGGGRLGYRLARKLDGGPVSVRLIERDAAQCEFLADRLDRVVVLNGDGSDQALLTEENIGDMDVVVTLTEDEETNILTSLLAKRMGARNTITRVSKFIYFSLMPQIGLEQVVSPRLSAINSILQHIRRGRVFSDISLKGEQAEILEAEALETADIVGKPLMETAIPKGVLITGIVRGDTVIIPSGETVIQPGDRVVMFARRQAISRIEKMLAVKLEYR